MEIAMNAGGSWHASMEVSGSFHRSTWKFPLSVEVQGLNCFHQFHIPRVRSVEISMSSQFPYTPKYIHVLPRIRQRPAAFTRLPQGSTEFRSSTCIDVSTNFYGNFHGRQFSSMEASIEDGGRICLLAWKFQVKLLEVDLLLCKLMEASMEVLGIFHCRWKLKLPLLRSNEASTNMLRSSFHELSYIPIYFYLFPRVSQTCSCLHKTNPNPNSNPNPIPKLELPPLRLA